MVAIWLIRGVIALEDLCSAQRRKFFSGARFGTLPSTFCGGLQKMWRDGWPATEPPPYKHNGGGEISASDRVMLKLDTPHVHNGGGGTRHPDRMQCF